MSILEMALYALCGLALLTVIAPFVRSDWWVFRVFDYPRMQKLVIITVLLLALLWVFGWPVSPIDYVFPCLMLLSVVYLCWVVFPFTPLSKPMLQKASDTSGPSFHILVANVYQDNRSYQKVLDLVALRRPDIVFLVETDQRWADAVQGLKSDYPHYIELPQSNTYGLLFYSKLPILHREVHHLVDPEIPSLMVDVAFESQSIRLFALHPTPPVPQENPKSTDRDAEILIVGKRVKEYQGPCVVLGDLNDVAWSHTTTLFLKTSELLDPRRGRGIFSTFHARYWLLRWPLDHYFVSAHFRLVSMKVEGPVDSDHFPISIRLQLSSEDNSEVLRADADEKAEADDKISKAT